VSIDSSSGARVVAIRIPSESTTRVSAQRGLTAGADLAMAGVAQAAP